MLKLICLLLVFSKLLTECTTPNVTPNMSLGDGTYSYSYMITLNGNKTTYSQSAGWLASVTVNGSNSSILKPNSPTTTNNVTTTLTVVREDCNTVLVKWDLVNNENAEKIVGACVFADAWIIVDQDTWTLQSDHRELFVEGAPFYIVGSEPFSGIMSGNRCGASEFNLGTSDMLSFNWNSVVLPARGNKTFEVRYSNSRINTYCTERDIKTGFGPCINDTRDIVFYTTNCSINEDFHVPAPLLNKSCNFACTAGHYFDLTSNSTDCSTCAAGKEAEGFSVIYNNVTASNIAPFTSNCSGTNCSNWTVWGNYLGSYLTTQFQPVAADVNLTLSVDIFQTAGQVLFEYTSPETRWTSARLDFYIDDHLMNNSTYISDVWKSDHYPLSFGKHTLRWEYKTDYLYNPSEIGARLRNIEIRGTKYLVTACRNCADGSTSVAGGQCTPCNFNQVPGSGTGVCVTCPNTQYAYPGDTQCQDRSPCVETDYYEEYGPCVNNQRTVTKQLYTPVICLEGTKPPTTTATCPKCDPGHYRKSGTCVPCEDGTYRNETMDDDTTCLVCPGGTYASKRDSNMRPTFSNNSWYKTGCESDARDINNCATPGWLEEEKVITSGNHFGPVTVWLNRTLNSSEFGTLFFSYTTYLRDDSYFKFYSSSYDYLMVNSTENKVKKNFTAYFYADRTTQFSWLFIKTCHNGCPKNDYNITDMVEIDELSISTESVGGGTECTTCSAGYFAPEGSAKCQECLAGTYSANGSAECTQCPPGTYSNYNYATECKECLNNTASSEDHSECVFDNCGFQHNETFAFSLAALQTNDGMINATRPNNESRLIYLDICTTAKSNETCRDYYDKEPDGGDITYACTVSTNQNYYSYMLGREAQMNYLEEKDADEQVLRYGVNLTYTNGNSYYCEQIRKSVILSIEILFVCVPESGMGEPLPATPFEDETECRMHYEWITEYACRICSTSDYDKLEGACNKGKKNTTYVIRPNQTPCTHGYVPNPIWQISSCPNPLVKLSAGAVVGIVIGAIVILGASIFAIVFYIRKNRALRYQLFQKSNFSLMDRNEEEAETVADTSTAATTSMFGGGTQEQGDQYKSVNFSGPENADSAY